MATLKERLLLPKPNSESYLQEYLKISEELALLRRDLADLLDEPPCITNDNSGVLYMNKFEWEEWRTKLGKLTQNKTEEKVTVDMEEVGTGI